tara:strand:+ start:374 stop:1756 length:1383 start_codon:yes stop_codon:yes gene_type:complete
MVIAIVPMKIHSSRVPNKNIRLFNGKPLFYHIIQSLYECKSVEKVVVDTDSGFLAHKVLEHFPDVQIHMRPDELHGDTVSMNNILTFLIQDMGMPPEQVLLQTHSTNPLLTPETIERAIQKFTASENDSLFGVNEWKTRLYNKESEPVNHDPENLIQTQDLEPLYEENSCIYIFKAETLYKHKRRIGKTPMIFKVPCSESHDIDTEHDWTNALQSFNIRQNINKTVWITGVCGGIGSALVEYFRGCQWDVIGTDIVPPSPELENILTRFENIDLTRSQADITNFVKTIPRLDCLINNAAVQICQKDTEYSFDDYDTIFNCNVKMAYFLAVECSELLSRNRGSVLNIGSVHATQTSEKISLYAMSKACIVGMTRSLSMGFSKRGIRVNTLSPGAVNTPMLAAGLQRESKTLQELADKHLTKKICEPLDIASVAYTVVTGPDSWTGQNIVVDGGATIKLSTE